MLFLVIGLFVLSIILMYILTKKKQTKKMWFVVFFDISLILAFLSYHWIPSKEYDLFRYYEWLENMQRFKGSELISYLFNRGEYLTMAYFYVISVIGNFSLLQFFPVLIGYIIIFYLIIDYSFNKKTKWFITLFCTLIVLSLFKYISMVSVFRASLAFLVFTLMLYLREYKNLNSKITAILCILSILIHNSMILVVGIFLLTFIKNKKIVLMFYLVLLFTLIFAIPIENFIAIFFEKTLIFSLFHKLSLYLSFDFSLTLQSIFRFCQLCLLIYIQLLLFFNKKDKNNQYDKFINYFILFILLFIPWYSIWHRFLDLLLFISIPNILSYFNNKKNTFNYYALFVLLIIMIIGGIIIQIPTVQEMKFSF